MFLELQSSGKGKKYYLSHSIRGRKGVRKLRVYLGVNLAEGELKKRIRLEQAKMRKKLAVSSGFHEAGIATLSRKLSSFSRATVRKTAKLYNKAFHAKLFTLFASSESEVHAFAQRFSPHYGFCFAFMNRQGVVLLLTTPTSLP